MLVSRIKIAHHGRIADLDVEVHGNAIIVGANDVGKTSILRLLDLLHGATTGQLYQRLALADLADPSAELVVEAVLTSFADEERCLFPRRDHHRPRRQLGVPAGPVDRRPPTRTTWSVTISRWFPEVGRDRPPSRSRSRRSAGGTCPPHSAPPHRRWG